MRNKIQALITILLVCAFLVACGPSQDTVATQVAANINASQTAQALIPSATSIPSPTASSTPTLIPSPTVTNTPLPTPTVTPTPTPVTIGVDNAAQVSLLDTLTVFEGMAGIIFSPQGLSALRVSEDNTIQKTYLQPHIPLSDLGQTTWLFGAPAFSSDGKMFTSQARDENGVGLTVWEVQDNLSLKPIARNISGYTYKGFYSGYPSDGKYLVSISIPDIMNVPMTADIWRKCTPNCIFTVTHIPVISKINRLPDGKLVSELGITSVDSFEYRFSFSPGNVFLATVSHRTDSNINVFQYIQIWRVSDGNLYRYLEPMSYEGQNGEVANLAFSPVDADLAIICGARLRVWQWELNTFRWTVDGIFSALGYSPDGTLLVTGAPDGSVQLWQASDGKALATLRGYKQAITYVAFSPDGSLLATWDENGTLKLWSVPR